MRLAIAFASAALIGTAFVTAPGCSSDTETQGTGGATTTTGTTSGTTTGTAGSGGQTPTGGQGGASGGTGGSGAQGAGVGVACGDFPIYCYGQEICVAFVDTQGPQQTTTWECRDDPCAPEPVSCTCASDICEGAMCQMNLDELECHSGGPCTAPDTPIATPTGDRPMSELAVGDVVYSMHQGRLQVVPIAQTNRTPVQHHAVSEVRLANGATLRISARHPTADGRLFRDLDPGTLLGDQPIVSVATVPYGEPFTYDILPASDTGTYLAGGALIGSTLTAP